MGDGSADLQAISPGQMVDHPFTITAVDLIQRLPDADRRTLRAARMSLITSCMEKRGFEYDPPSPDEVTFYDERSQRMRRQLVNPQRTWSDPSRADQFGYGYRREISRQVDRLPSVASLGNPLPPEADRAYASGLEEIKLPGGGVITYNNKGCYPAAQESIYGDYRKWMKVRDFAANVYPRKAQARMDTDPRVVAADRAWGACMTEAGWPGLETSLDAVGAATHPKELIDANGLVAEESWDKAKEVEIAVAMADVACQAETDSLSIRLKVRQEVLSDVKADSNATVLTYLGMRAEGLERARKVLED